MPMPCHPQWLFYYMNLCSLWNFHHNHYSESLLFIIPTCPQAGDHTQSLDHASQVLIHTPITLITQGWVAASLLQGSGLWSILPKNKYHHSPSCELSMRLQVLDLPFGHPLVIYLPCSGLSFLIHRKESFLPLIVPILLSCCTYF